MEDKNNDDHLVSNLFMSGELTDSVHKLIKIKISENLFIYYIQKNVSIFILRTYQQSIIWVLKHVLILQIERQNFILLKYYYKNPSCTYALKYKK